MKKNNTAKTSNDVTELVFIIDKSGSMAGMESDTVGGFNAMIEKQKKLEGKALVTTVLFSTETTMLHDRIDIRDVEKLTENDYCVGGGTALLDAIGETVEHIKKIHKYVRAEDVPSHTLFFITTDGLENSSRRYGSDKVKKLIKECEEKNGWEFLFVAANIDAVETAGQIGIRPDRAANYKCDSMGTAALFACAGEAISCVRKNKSLSGDWAEGLDGKKASDK